MFFYDFLRLPLKRVSRIYSARRQACKKICMPSAKWENGKPGLALCNPHEIYLLFVKARLEINLLDSLQQAYIALDKPKNIKLPHSKKFRRIHRNSRL